MVKKSGIQMHRVAAVRAKAMAGSSGLALSLGWVGGEVGAGKRGGPSRGDCETGRVSVSLRGSSGGGLSGMGLSGRQLGKGVGVLAGPQEAALPPSPQTGPQTEDPIPHPQTWEPQALSAPAGDIESVLGEERVITECQGERGRGPRGGGLRWGRASSGCQEVTE